MSGNPRFFPHILAYPPPSPAGISINNKSYVFFSSCKHIGYVYSEIKRNFKEHLQNILISTSVYARMSPVQKIMLIEDLKQIGYSVGMCGDGANDCGALRVANAGI